MRSAILLLAIVAAVSATAIRQQPKKEHLTKEIKHHTKEERVQNAAKVHQKIGDLSGKAYFQALVASGKDAALKDELCKMCLKLITDIETFGEDTALDYLEPEVEIMCDGLPWDNLKKDCTDWVMSIVDDLIDILNDYTDGENACVGMTLCDA